MFRYLPRAFGANLASSRSILPIIALTIVSVTASATLADVVKSVTKISATSGNFQGPLNTANRFGIDAAPIGDLDGDGIGDVAVGAYFRIASAGGSGSAWVLFLNADGTVKAEQEIADGIGGFSGDLDFRDEFGVSLAGLGDLDGDGVPDLAVGARLDDDGGENSGAVWVLFLNSDGTVKSHQKISATSGSFGGVLSAGDWFGHALEPIGDVDADGVQDLAVAALFDADGGPARGAVWILFLNDDGTVKSQQKISSTQGSFTGILGDANSFGHSLGAVGDFDGDGVPDLAVGGARDDDGVNNAGAVWMLFLNSDGSVKAHQKISLTEGNFNGALDFDDRFGAGLAAPGDLNCDGIPDLVVGATGDDDGSSNAGAVWFLLLNDDGTVKDQKKLSATEGGLGASLGYLDEFGEDIAAIGDIDGDGMVDILVGARLDDDGRRDAGAVYVIFLNSCLNESPDCSNAVASLEVLWPPNHQFQQISIEGVTDPEGDPVDITITGVTQDEPLGRQRSGNSCQDARLHQGNLELRAARDGHGNGRVYEVSFSATDAMGASCDGKVTVCVPHTPAGGCIDDGQAVDSFGACERRAVDQAPRLAIETNTRTGITDLRYSLLDDNFVQITAFNVAGRRIETLVRTQQTAGTHSIAWNTASLATGVYYVRMQTGTAVETRSVVIIK